MHNGTVRRWKRRRRWGGGRHLVTITDGKLKRRAWKEGSLGEVGLEELGHADGLHVL